MTAPLPPLPRSPVASWMIDDDGAQHPCLVAPTFSTAELQSYAKLAVREALERLIELDPECAEARAMLKEYSDD